MKSVLCLVQVVLMSLAMQSAHAQMADSSAPDPNAPVYVVSYIDVVPPSKNAAIALLKQVRDACRKEGGNLRCELVQRLERQNQFALLEIWQNRKAFDTHETAAAQWRDKLKPMLNSPYDQRVQTAFSTQPPQPPPSGRIVYVLTHVDAVPPRAEEAGGVLAQMAEASRREPGAGRVEVTQQLAPLANHFTIVEIWTNRKVLEAHQMTSGYIQYRDKLQPTLGALYDERLFKMPD